MFILNWKSKKTKIILTMFSVAVIIFLATLVLINIHIINSTTVFISNTQEELPSAEAAIVLGALVYQDGRMSDIFFDRVQTGLELYQSGKVSKLLVSGDHGRDDYDEVNAAKEYLLASGVLPGDVFLDHAGFDTYDSMYRARDIFDIKKAIVVTQRFHLSRAVHIGRELGMDVYGMEADKRTYVMEKYNKRREFLARIKAFLDLVIGAKPKYLGDIVPINGDGRLSWD